MDLLLQQIVNGLSVGMGYALVALGLTLVFGVMHVVNFAHGEFYMLGGLAACMATGTLSLSYWVALPLTALVGGLAGWLVDRLAVRGVLDRKGGDGNVMLTTFAASLIIFELVLGTVGTQPTRVPGLEGGVDIGPVYISLQRLLIFGVGVVLLVVLHAIVQRSSVGRQMRAVAQDAFAAHVVGINVQATGTATFVLAAMLAAIAGGVLVPVANFTPFMGSNMIIKAFVVVIIGGMGSISGAVLCGLLLGVLEAVGSIYLQQGIALILIYSLILVGLLVRPQGLFGRA
jgi:branched-chain amino acid transport system permease protein